MFDAATDRLVSRVTSSGTHYYMYDRAGNLVVDSVPGGVVWHYGYDAVDRLVSARRNGVLIARYGYDVLGCRIVKRVYSMQTGADTLYLRMVYTGSHVAFETDSAGTMGLKYTWGPGSDNLLAIEDSLGNHYYATTDRLGSIRTLAKRDGTWLLTRRWDPYGNEISRDSSASFTWGKRLRYGWTGREYDVEIGMYYHRARYYSQSLRRFIQEDPVEGSTSPYAYVHGSPLEATDPSGMLDSYEMRMTDGDLAFKISISASSDARLNGLLAWGDENYNRYASTGGAELYATVANGDGTTREVACRDLSGACDEWLAAHGESRPLTAEEAKAAKSELPGLNTDVARVAYDSPSGRSAFTPRNTMHFPKYTSDCQDFITCKNGGYAGWFIHEATHVWQYQTGRSPFWGHILSEDVFTFRGDYLPRDGMSGYMNLPSVNGLSTEKQADWHQWHYELCTVQRIPSACAWR